MTAAYWFATRPPNVEHHHPYLVFDCQDRLHLPLTIYGKEANQRLSPKTAQTYLYAILPWFTYLDSDAWQTRAGNTWSAPPRQVRQALEDYLVSKLRCKVQPHQAGWRYVSLTTGTQNSLRVFLSALKLFYQVMIARGFYSFLNPMIESVSATVAMIEVRLGQEEGPPRMPDLSGVEAPQKKPAQRLTDNYFRLQYEEWAPQILDDAKFPALILQGGKHLSLKHTRQRDEVVTWLLFETGARVSEVCGLTLGDWASQGTHTKVRAFNKGSLGRRTKTLSFHEDTVVLLRRYFDEERIHFDPHGYSLDLYLELAAHKQVDLSTIPLFLTAQGTQLTPKAYREHYWNPACDKAGITADIHQAHHWLVTRSVRDIYETSKDKSEIERRLKGLVEYMKWKSEATLAAYQHYFDEQLDADTRDVFHQRMHEEIQHYQQERRQGKQRKPIPCAHTQEEPMQSQREALQVNDEPDLAFLYSLAGEA
ncbi:MAG TPA: site-specific integrase [Ktedonobacteraceae bacterium]|nr:site-specific integrase [Ktedonobacteraceae bacterium]